MKQKSGSDRLNRLLKEMVLQEGYLVSVLSDIHGLTIAWAASEHVDPERQSAMVALVQRTAVQVTKKLGMANTDEMTVNDANGQKLICRPFTIDNNTLILAVMVAEKDSSYRRATNHVIREINHIWKTYWA
jgi:predicted regulator of Ras-like GTPase activity (Roadblock/LC7/MglB family)